MKASTILTCMLILMALYAAVIVAAILLRSFHALQGGL